MVSYLFSQRELVSVQVCERRRAPSFLSQLGMVWELQLNFRTSSMNNYIASKLVQTEYLTLYSEAFFFFKLSNKIW